MMGRHAGDEVQLANSIVVVSAVLLSALYLRSRLTDSREGENVMNKRAFIESSPFLVEIFHGSRFV